MKNIFFALAFMLIGTAIFASNAIEGTHIENEITIQFNSINDIENITFFDYSNLLVDCTITVKKKNPDGTWDEYKITIHGKTCKEVIKDIFDAMK